MGNSHKKRESVSFGFQEIISPMRIQPQLQQIAKRFLDLSGLVKDLNIQNSGNQLLNTSKSTPTNSQYIRRPSRRNIIGSKAINTHQGSYDQYKEVLEKVETFLGEKDDFLRHKINNVKEEAKLKHQIMQIDDKIQEDLHSKLPKIRLQMRKKIEKMNQLQNEKKSIFSKNEDDSLTPISKSKDEQKEKVDIELKRENITYKNLMKKIEKRSKLTQSSNQIFLSPKKNNSNYNELKKANNIKNNRQSYELKSTGFKNSISDKKPFNNTNQMAPIVRLNSQKIIVTNPQHTHQQYTSFDLSKDNNLNLNSSQFKTVMDNSSVLNKYAYPMIQQNRSKSVVKCTKFQNSDYYDSRIKDTTDFKSDLQKLIKLEKFKKSYEQKQSVNNRLIWSISKLAGERIISKGELGVSMDKEGAGQIVESEMNSVYKSICRGIDRREELEGFKTKKGLQTYQLKPRKKFMGLIRHLKQDYNLNPVEIIKKKIAVKDSFDFEFTRENSSDVRTLRSKNKNL